MDNLSGKKLIHNNNVVAKDLSSESEDLNKLGQKKFIQNNNNDTPLFKYKNIS